MSSSNLFKIVFTLGLLALIVIAFGPGKMARAFRGADYGLTVLAFLLTPVIIFFKAFRWHVLARSKIADMAFLTSVKSYLAGLALAVVTPLSSGEIARGLFVPQGDWLALTGLVLLDKFLDLTVVLAYGFLGLAILYPGVTRLLCVLSIAMILAAWMLVSSVVEGLTRLMPRMATRGRWKPAFEALRAVSPGLIAKCLGIAFVNFAVYYFQVYLMLKAFAADFPVQAVCLLPIPTLSTILPYAIGGLGIRELTAGLLLQPFGVSPATAASGYLAHFVLIMVIPGTLGAFCIGEVWTARRTVETTPPTGEAERR